MLTDYRTDVEYIRKQMLFARAYAQPRAYLVVFDACERALDALARLEEKLAAEVEEPATKISLDDQAEEIIAAESYLSQGQIPRWDPEP